MAPGERYHLKHIDPHDDAGIDEKGEAKDLVEELQAKLQSFQQCLYAQGRHALLIVLQGMDTGGKDGTIRHVMGAFDPQGVIVTPFKVPTEEELAHDFLWRIHKAVPRRGMIGIFNRSHYEDVLVVRVRKLAPEEVWRARYEQINQFEKLLSDNGVAVVKLFLHISPEEQAERLRERQTRPDKQWKFNPGDLEDRALWHDFQTAYEDALTLCNTAWAPWYVVPADRKWFRNLAVSRILLDVFEGLELAFPKPVPDIDSYVIPDVPERQG
ncbi:MAG: polyphosphate kinase 2 family protein [Acidobacteria bacterium]|nr:polyphosphate kinase 2 family protein [Acidobacteriota bacterium]